MKHNALFLSTLRMLGSNASKLYVGHVGNSPMSCPLLLMSDFNGQIIHSSSCFTKISTTTLHGVVMNTSGISLCHLKPKKP